jgi:hypothetical protein
MSVLLVMKFDKSNCITQRYLLMKRESFGMMPYGSDELRI